MRQTLESRDWINSRDSQGDSRFSNLDDTCRLWWSTKSSEGDGKWEPFSFKAKRTNNGMRKVYRMRTISLWPEGSNLRVQVCRGAKDRLLLVVMRVDSGMEAVACEAGDKEKICARLAY